jgi:hypothetical protein
MFDIALLHRDDSSEPQIPTTVSKEQGKRVVLHTAATEEWVNEGGSVAPAAAAQRASEEGSHVRV